MAVGKPVNDFCLHKRRCANSSVRCFDWLSPSDLSNTSFLALGYQRDLGRYCSRYTYHLHKLPDISIEDNFAHRTWRSYFGKMDRFDLDRSVGDGEQAQKLVQQTQNYLEYSRQFSHWAQEQFKVLFLTQRGTLINSTLEAPAKYSHGATRCCAVAKAVLVLLSSHFGGGITMTSSISTEPHDPFFGSLATCRVLEMLKTIQT